MYKIIRCGTRCDLVIVVSPETATPDTLDAKYFRFATWQIGDSIPGEFCEISSQAAMGYFGGQADGLGRAAFPREPFASLADIEAWIQQQREPHKITEDRHGSGRR
jgi:hypothetical protein